MNRSEFRSAAVALTALLIPFSPPLHAEEDVHRHHEAHEHGVGQLNIAVEGRELHLELESPAMNIVGFEHAPRNEQEHHAVEHAVEQLRRAERLFITSAAAGCRLHEAEVESGLMEADDEHHEAHHDEAHGDEKHDAHHEEGHGEEAHADFEASYRFACNNPAALSTLTVKLFETFPATEELEVQLLRDRGQTAVELTTANAVINLQ
ncbi:hypothetical protein BOW53_05640 [Solemya pervernicosa gill symbiont]|uniref:Zinc-binding protein n=1 Tax=Solemya pervernicosa gill symbiont TaxID=642797 RepID=A0A1T2L7C6_9GAMM|nr:DUF2796 domain-containing protein [Solemya pervernicosa gill symbiont]OOZ41005.1 hypothetical protein BOW53_05640 [Solemya pervernicosa gill symbiont]